MARHRELSPSCPFVHNPASSGNIPIILSSPSFDGSITARSSNPAAPPPAPSESSSSLSRPPINSTQSAHLGMYNHSYIFRREALRLDTFRNWPIPHIVSPQRLAKAGFFYQGTGDQVCDTLPTYFLPFQLSQKFTRLSLASSLRKLLQPLSCPSKKS